MSSLSFYSQSNQQRRNWYIDQSLLSISNARVLVVKSLTQPVWIVCIRATLVSIVNLNLSPPSWLGWIKLLDTVLNWSLSLMTFSISLPIILRRTMGLNDLGESYDFLLGLGITIILEILKCDGQYPKLIQELAIWMKLSRHSLFSKIILR